MSEHALQVAVARMLQLVLDPNLVWWSAIDHAAKLGVRYGAERKRRGVKRGLPDFIILPMRQPLIGLELKTDAGRLSPAQVEVAFTWLKMGHKMYIARSLEQVQDILDREGVPMLRRMNFFNGGSSHGRASRAARTRHPRAQRKRKSENSLPLVLSRQT